MSREATVKGQMRRTCKVRKSTVLTAPPLIPPPEGWSARDVVLAVVGWVD